MRGTSDGWRGILAGEITIPFITRLAGQIASHLHERGRSPRVIVGHDSRFMSDYLAAALAEKLLRCGIGCQVASKPTATPVVAFATRSAGLDLGLTITASHNPPHYSGLKVRMPDGSPPPDEVIDSIERHEPCTPAKTSGHADKVDPVPQYAEQVRALVDPEVLKRQCPHVAVDSMHGATRGLLRAAIGQWCSVTEVRQSFDPLFGGISPEPVQRHLAPLVRAVHRTAARFGVAHDGDGDRIAAYIPEIGHLSPNELAVIISLYLGQERGLGGQIVATVASTRRLREVAALLGRPYVEVPIGFRHAAWEMQRTPTLVASEENGGIGLGIHMPDRDGTAVAAILAEIDARMNLGRYVLSARSHLGEALVVRRDVRTDVPPAEITAALDPSAWVELDGSPIAGMRQLDGLKVWDRAGNWVLFRPSGTEPLLRLYAEKDGHGSGGRLLDWAEGQIQVTARRV